MKLVTVAQMQELEARSEAAGVSTATLMENAGLAVAQEVWMLLGTLEERRILVLVGPGNNGGDGLVAARHLYEWGAQLALYLLAPRPDDDPNYAAVVERGLPITLADDDPGYETLDGLLGSAELIVDALLGTGRSRAVEGSLAEVLRRLAGARNRMVKPRVVAVDLPSGLDADTGAADPLAVRADLTVALGFPKVGLYAGAAADYTGRIQEVEIGIPAAAMGELQPLELLDRAAVKRALPARPADANKGTFGRLVAVAGSRRYVGAAYLTAAAVYRAGAGYVTLAAPESVYPLLAMRIAEATFLPLADEHGIVTAGAAAEVLDDLKDENTLLVGPGLGGGADDCVRALLGDGRLDGLRAVVVDGDALNALSRWPGWHERVRGRLILTPHPGEMARLAETEIAAVQGARLRLAVERAAAWGVVVVLKGAGTVIAAPDGRAWLSPWANPALATAGSGDVLAGVIAGLAAQGLDPALAAACGVYLHGMAGDAARKELGPAGVMAGDLLIEIPKAIKALVEPSAAPAAGLLGGGLFGGALGGQMGGGQGTLGDLGGMAGGGLAGLGGLGGGLGGALGGMPGLGNPG